MRLACVVHRFGADIAGGSEAHCRIIAERLAERHDVTVYTTTAKDHVTWKNEYPPGVSRHGRLEVRRFPGGAPAIAAPVRRAERAASSAAQAPKTTRSSGSGRTVRRHRSSSTTSPPTRTATIACCSGRFATTRRSLVCRSCAIARCSCRRPKTIRSCGSTSSARFFSLPSRLRVPDPGRGGPRRAPRRRPRWRPPASSDPGSSLRRRSPRGSAGRTRCDAARSCCISGRIDPNKGCRTLLNHYQRYQSETSSDGPAGDGRAGQHADSRPPARPPAGLRERRGARAGCCRTQRPSSSRRPTRA